jgi:hypothetical protein
VYIGILRKELPMTKISKIYPDTVIIQVCIECNKWKNAEDENANWQLGSISGNSRGSFVGDFVTSHGYCPLCALKVKAEYIKSK